MQCHKGCRLEHPLQAMSLVSWGVERLTRFSLSLYLFRLIWLNVYKVLLCLHCWGITTIRCPSMLAYGLANNNLVCGKINLWKKFLEEVVEAQHNTGADDAIELCTINLNKDAIQSCESYTEEVYNKCMSKLPASESKVYDVEVLNIISSSCNNHERRYRYISQVVILLSCKD